MPENEVFRQMMRGDLYKFDEQLMAKMKNIRKDLGRFNYELRGNDEDRKAIIRKIFKKTGKNFEITPPFHCDYGFNITIGENFYSNYNLVILDVVEVNIGNNVLIGPNVGIYAAGHPLNPNTRMKGYEYGENINIGNNVWIGGHTVINPGITIGDNVVIGSGSVVTRDIPSNTLAVGVPCKVLRTLNEHDYKYFYKDKEIPPELL